MKPKPKFVSDGYRLYERESIVDFIVWWEAFIHDKNRFRYGAHSLEVVEEWEVNGVEDFPKEAVGLIKVPEYDFYAGVIDFMDVFYREE